MFLLGMFASHVNKTMILAKSALLIYEASLILRQVLQTGTCSRSLAPRAYLAFSLTMMPMMLLVLSKLLPSTLGVCVCHLCVGFQTKKQTGRPFPSIIHVHRLMCTQLLSRALAGEVIAPC